MQTSQKLSNPTLKNLDSYEYAIIAVINFRTWMKYINKIKDGMEKKIRHMTLIRGWRDLSWF